VIYLRFSIFFICTVLAAVSTAEIYRWVDKDGQVHFGDKPLSGSYDVIEEQPTEKNNSEFNTPAQAIVDSTKDSSREEDLEDTADDVTSETSEQLIEETTGLEETSEIPSSDEELRQKRVEELEALAEELRIAREKRESKREKEKRELRLLKEGCANAQARADYLQTAIDKYLARQSRGNKDKSQSGISLDSRHQRMTTELRARKKYLNENCGNL